MRILMSGGGTAGHVLPVLAVVQALADAGSPKMNERMEFLYLGCPDSPEEEIVSREGVPFQAIQAGGLRGKMPWTAAWNGLKLMVGWAQAYLAIGHFRPQVLLVTGGYVSVPVVIAARLRRIPTLIYLPDIVPGLAIRRLARWVSRVAVSFPEAISYFEPGKAVVTGYPVRRAFFKTDKAEARARLGLKDDLPVVTAFGGSRGAHTINVAVAAILRDLLPESQVVHICGQEDAPEAIADRQTLPPDLQERYHPYAYFHEEMADALAAADLVVARAGASTLGEFPALGLPSILVPYPYSGQHQDANADYLVSHGAAVRMADADLQQELLPTVLRLLRDRSELHHIGECARALSRPDAAYRIAAELRSLAAV